MRVQGSNGEPRALRASIAETALILALGIDFDPHIYRFNV